MGEATAMGNKHGLFHERARAARITAPEENSSAAARFLQEHEDTKDALRASEDHNASLTVQLKDLLRENEEFRQKLAEAERRVLFLQGYSTEITTCLEILRQSNDAIIGRAVKKAHENGISNVKIMTQDTNVPQRAPVAESRVQFDLREASPRPEASPNGRLPQNQM